MVVKKYILNVDLMRRYSAKTPEFRRGDSGTLIFRVFNNGVEFDINRATKAEVYHETSMGTQIPTDCTFTTLNGKRVIQYDYEKIIMVELGFTKTMLVIYEGDTAVSIIPFNVWIYSDMKGGANSYLELIQDLGNQIEDLIMDLNNTIPQSEKGKPNGVASLDGSGKIPLSQMPKEVDSYLKHMDETVDEHHVHGMKRDADGLWMYQTANGDWQYFGFSDTAVGGGAPQVQLLEATIVVSNGIANTTYTGTPTLAASKWATGTRDKSYFATNGTTFTGSSFVVSQLGMYTLFYRDSNGVEYVKAFAVTASMMPSADISVDVEDGYVTVDIVGNIAIQKWAKGEQNVTYFAYNGTTFTGNTFEVTEVGKYTIYYKLTSGLEYVYVFEVTQRMLGIDEPVNPFDVIIDANLRVLINLSLSNSYSTDPITLTQLEQLTKLNMSQYVIEARKVKNLDGIQYAKNLKEIELLYLGADASSYIDLSPIGKLNGLIVLNLDSAKINTIAPLKTLTELIKINIAYTKIDSLSHLNNCNKLEDINIDGITRQVTSEPLLDLNIAMKVNLVTLNAFGIGISNVSYLSGLSGITALYLNSNNISDWTPLRGKLVNLDSFYATNNPSTTTKSYLKTGI